MYSMPVRTVCTFFPAGNEDGQIPFSSSQQPAILGIDLIRLLQIAREKNLVHELVGEVALPGFVSLDPFLEDDALDAAHGLHLGDAGVGDPVHVTAEQLGFVGGGQIAIVGHALIEIVGDEVEDVFLKIGSGTRDAVNLVLADHLGEGKSQLCRAHGAANGDEHLSARGEMGVIALGGIDQCGGIEMTIVVLDKRSNRRHSLWVLPYLNYHS